jgi:hypothetical protein
LAPVDRPLRPKVHPCTRSSPVEPKQCSEASRLGRLSPLEVEFRHDCRMVGGGVGLVRYHAQTPGHFVHAPALDGNRPQRLPQRLEHQQIVDLVLRLR